MVMQRELMETVYLFLDISTILTCRAVCVIWREHVESLERWRPACLPPGLSSLDSPGSRVHIYCRWGRWCRLYNSLVETLYDCSFEMKETEKQRRMAAARLKTMCTAWDGWCALAPYHNPRGKCTQWIQKLAAGPEIPPEPERRCGRGKRTRSGKLVKRRKPEDEPSVYFQQRCRASEEVFRTWLTVPVHDHMTVVEEEGIYAAGTLQLEVVHVTGDDRLAAHDPVAIAQWLGVAERLLACFLPPHGSFAIHHLPDRSIPLDQSISGIDFGPKARLLTLKTQSNPNPNPNPTLTLTLTTAS